MLTRHLFLLMCAYHCCVGYQLKQYVTFNLNKKVRGCVNSRPWKQGSEYLAHNKISASVLTLNEKLSCVASNVAPIPAGVVEANIFVHLASKNDSVSILVYEAFDGSEKLVGRADIFATDRNVFNGSHTLTVPIKESNGYVSVNFQYHIK